MDNVKPVEIDHVREKLIDLLTQVQSYGVKQGSHLMHQEGLTNREVADHLLANGVTFVTDNNVGGKWIPVSERLPDEDVRVIVRIDRTVWNTTFELDADRRHNGDWVRWGRAVTDWMPMPEYAKGE